MREPCRGQYVLLRMKILLVLLLAACTMHAQQPDLSSLNWDGRIVYECNSIKSESLKEVSRFISDGARTMYIGAPIALYTYGVLASAIDEPSAANRYAAQTGLQAATALVLSYGIAVGAKNIVNRERPYVAHPDLIVNGEGRVDTHMNSFPSGHSTGTAAMTTTLILRYPKWYVIAPSVGYALWMGFSRMNLGVHYFTDVLGGYAIGAGVACGVHLLSNELFKLAEPILPSDGSIAVGLGGTPTNPVFTLSMSF
jgi:membrane-associated phospholipid phosphatase